MGLFGEIAHDGLKKSILDKLVALREQCRLDADREHRAQNYQMEAEHRHWVSALSHAIMIVEKETY